MKNLIAYCGLDCEKCDARIATVNNDNALREKTAKLWSELNGVSITPEMIHCMGCRGDGVKTTFCGSMCEIRKCALKNCVETCGGCGKFHGCKIVSAITDHNHEAEENLKRAAEEK
jgi:hypothetical protein